MLTKEEVQEIKVKYDRHTPTVLASAIDLENLIITIQKQEKEISELKLNVMISEDAHKDEIQRRIKSDKEIRRLMEIIEQKNLLLEQKYRVYDDRNSEESLYIGTHLGAMQFINDNHIPTAFENIWMEEVK